jgi:PAS domain-containing protein
MQDKLGRMDKPQKFLARWWLTKRNRAIGRKESADKLAATPATLEALRDGILATDEQGRMTVLNTKFVETFRIPEELVELRDGQKTRVFIAEV